MTEDRGSRATEALKPDPDAPAGLATEPSTPVRASAGAAAGTFADEDDESIPLVRRVLLWWGSWKGALAGLLLLALGAGIWWGRDVYLAIKDWRAERLLAAAEVAQQKGDEVGSRDKLRQAIALVQRQPKTLRAVAQYYAKHGDRAAVAYYEMLEKMGEATVEDRITGARLAFRFGLVEKGSEFVQSLVALPEAAVRPAVIALQAEERALAGRWPEALALGRTAVAGLRAGEGGEERLLLARLLLRPPLFRQGDRATLQKEGLAILGELATQSDASGLLALQYLEGLTRDPETAALLKGAKVQPWIDAAARNAGADAATRVSCWDLRVAAEPERQEAIAQELFALAGSVSAEDRLEIARWLAHRGALALARDLAAPSKLDSEGWFMVYLDAVAGLGDWAAVLVEVTSNTRVPVSTAVRRVFQLRAETELQQHPDPGVAWNSIRLAMSSATPQQQLYIAGYAEQMNFPAEAAPIYRRLLKDQVLPLMIGTRANPQRLVCYRRALQTGMQSMTTSELAKFLGEFAQEFPAIDEVQNDAAYLRLLVGDAAPDVAKVADRLVREHPELLAYRTTAALAGLRGGRATEAGQLYAGLQIDWEHAPERYKAVYAAVLAANGRDTEAAAIREKLDPMALRPEERKLAGLLE